jgi:NAD(P)-dependent dehydrogenase (short-subunit alcohol dehydrogenase family)
MTMGFPDLFRLDGHVALVTGGGSGLGAAIAVAFAEMGADVAINARSADKLAGVAARIEALGRRAFVLAGDVTDRDLPARLVEGTVDALGGLSILVNNAGGTGGIDARPMPSLDTGEESWAAQIEINLTSVWRLTRAAAPYLRDGGSILNISSIKATRPENGSGAYGAAKAALDNMTIALAHDLAPRLRVNGIAPGPVPTEAFLAYRNVTEADFPRVAAEWGIPLGRVGNPQDIAAAAVYLSSPAAGWITGQTLRVTGGM